MEGSVPHIDILASFPDFTHVLQPPYHIPNTFRRACVEFFAPPSIDIAGCHRSSAANSIFSGSPFLRAFSSSSSTFLFPKNSAITHLAFSCHLTLFRPFFCRWLWEE